MKFILPILLLVATVAQAQDKEVARRFRATAIAGMNISQVDGDAEAGYRKLGLNAGVGVAAVLAKRWQVGLEMLYSMKGSADPNDRDGNGKTLKYTFHYIDVPFFVSFWDWKATDKIGEYMKIKIHLGAVYGRLFGGKLRENFVDLDPEEFENRYTKNTFGYILGAGIMFTRHIGAEFRWEQSILPFSNTANTNKQWHRLVTVRMMYEF